MIGVSLAVALIELLAGARNKVPMRTGILCGVFETKQTLLYENAINANLVTKKFFFLNLGQLSLQIGNNFSFKSC